MANKCKYCGKIGSHQCSVKARYVSEEDDSSDFLTSAVLGAAMHDVTGGGLIGGLIGGDIVGGLLGDMIADSIFGDD